MVGFLESPAPGTGRPAARRRPIRRRGLVSNARRRPIRRRGLIRAACRGLVPPGRVPVGVIRLPGREGTCFCGLRGLVAGSRRRNVVPRLVWITV